MKKGPKAQFYSPPNLTRPTTFEMLISLLDQRSSLPRSGILLRAYKYLHFPSIPNLNSAHSFLSASSSSEAPESVFSSPSLCFRLLHQSRDRMDICLRRRFPTVACADLRSRQRDRTRRPIRLDLAWHRSLEKYQGPHGSRIVSERRCFSAFASCAPFVTNLAEGNWTLMQND